MPNGVARRVAFIDLEDTVIEPVLQGWGAAMECERLPKVRRLLKEWRPDELRVFSFAIGNEKDSAGFEQHVKGWLQTQLGMAITLAPTVEGEILPAVCAELRLHRRKVDFSDLCDFLGKQQSFRLFVRHAFKSCGEEVEVMLVDDCVMNESFEWPDLLIKGMIVNIKKM